MEQALRLAAVTVTRGFSRGVSKTRDADGAGGSGSGVGWWQVALCSGHIFCC